MGREAARARPGERPRRPRRGGRRRGRGRQRPRHRARPRHPDRPPAAGRGRGGRTPHRTDPHAGPWTRCLAPAAAVPLRQGRGTALRHRPLLPDRTGATARPGGLGDRRRPDPAPAADHRLGTGRGHRVPGRSAHPRQRGDRVRLRGGRHLRLQLRLAGTPPALRGHRRRRRPGGAGERIRRAHPAADRHRPRHPLAHPAGGRCAERPRGRRTGAGPRRPGRSTAARQRRVGVSRARHHAQCRGVHRPRSTGAGGEHRAGRPPIPPHWDPTTRTYDGTEQK